MTKKKQSNEKNRPETKSKPKYGNLLKRALVAKKKPYKAELKVEDEGEKKDEAEFLSVVAWEKLATLINDFCHKGDRIAVIGSLKTNNYTSTKGERWHAVEIYAQEIEFLENKKQGNKYPELQEVDIPDDKLPF